MSDLSGLEIFLKILVVAIIVVFLTKIIEIIGLWKIFKKSNEEGWKSIIPIYNTYTLCKITGVSPYWILIIYIGYFIPVLNAVASIISIYFMILLNVSLSKSFGKDSVYAVGLIFLKPIFYFLLGTDSSSYQGPNPMKDIIFDNINKKESSSYQNTTINGTNYCSNCGTQIIENSLYCTNCGTKIK